jgi:hypothetical protein
MKWRTVKSAKDAGSSHHSPRILPRVAAAGVIGSLLLLIGEWQALGARRVAVAFALLVIGGVLGGYSVLVLDARGAPQWFGLLVLMGTVAIAFLSGIVVPPGTAVPPPLWPGAVAAGAVVGLRTGPAYGLAAGAFAGAVPVVSAAMSINAITPELAAMHTALVLSSVAPGVLAGALRPAGDVSRAASSTTILPRELVGSPDALSDEPLPSPDEAPIPNQAEAPIQNQ